MKTGFPGRRWRGVVQLCRGREGPEVAGNTTPPRGRETGKGLGVTC